jgi:hypothetical protein
MAVKGYRCSAPAPAAASKVAHRLPERVFKDPWLNGPSCLHTQLLPGAALRSSAGLLRLAIPMTFRNLMRSEFVSQSVINNEVAQQ